MDFTKRYETQEHLHHKVQLSYVRACALVQLILISDDLSGLRGNALEAKRQAWISKLEGRLNHQVRTSAFGAVVGGERLRYLSTTDSAAWLLDLVEETPIEVIEEQVRPTRKAVLPTGVLC